MKILLGIIISISLIPIIYALEEPTEIHVSSLDTQEKTLDQFKELYETRENTGWNKESSNYSAGILLTRVGAYDLKTGSYDLDFWFWVEIYEEDDPTDFTKNLPKFHFINSDAGTTIQDLTEHIEPHYYEARVQGTFFNEMDFSQFPFEKLNFIVEVEPDSGKSNLPITFVLEAEPGIDSTAKVPGWEIDQYTLSTTTHTYDEEETTSRFIANYIVERNPLGSFVKNILPVIVIAMLLCITTFWLPKDFMTKIELNVVYLLTLVFYMPIVLDTIPSLGYMTIFDKVVVMGYSVIVTGIVSAGLQMRMSSKDENNPKIKSVSRYALFTIAAILIIGIICLASNS